MSWYVYMARNPHGRIYTGIAIDVEARINEHNRGQGSRMAREQGPFVLVYQSATFSNKSAARLREAQIKRWRREKKENLISGAWV